ncbi:MAG: DUF6364 family protein [Caldilineaceae bacterium]|nr:DUF6364 family protein [Caldilineaceae bacterium]
MNERGFYKPVRRVTIAGRTKWKTRVRKREELRDLKGKLMLTIDRDVILAAQEYARSVGVSLSSLVEELLGSMICNKPEPFATRWRGSLKIVERDEPRFQAIKHKYLT